MFIFRKLYAEEHNKTSEVVGNFIYRFCKVNVHIQKRILGNSYESI